MKVSRLIYSMLFIVYSSVLSAASFDEVNLDSLKLISESKDIRIYLKEGVDLSQYTYLQVEKAQATLDKKWLDNYNRKRQSLSSKLNRWDVEEMTQDYASHFDEYAMKVLKESSDYKFEATEGAKGLRLEMYINKLIVYQTGETDNPRLKMISKEGEAELDTVMYDIETGEMVAVLLDHKETFERVTPQRAMKSRKTEMFEPIYDIWMQDLLAVLTMKDE
ncbi:MAG: hypothetical protein HKP09_05900 [Enterobacterales bacterium]|nr:hypothetical protein [Enterobacterales bacterium]